MSPIYEVIWEEGGLEDRRVVSVRQLSGKDKIQKDGVIVPVEVEGETVTINITKSKGNLEKALLRTPKGCDTLSEWRKRDFQSVSIKPVGSDFEREILSIIYEDIMYCSIEGHKDPPEVTKGSKERR